MKTFSDGDLVKIVKTADPSLDGQQVLIVGNEPIQGTNFYTIEKESREPFHTGYRTIRLIESCLEPVENNEMTRLNRAVINLVRNVIEKVPHIEILYQWDRDRGTAWFGKENG